jgi:hypothetical protein
VTFPTFPTTFNALVKHTSGATVTTLADVQNVVISQGRNNLSDTYKSAVINIEGRDPDGLPNIRIGDAIEVTLELYDNGSLSDSTVFTGRVANFERDYGVIPELDRWVIRSEDAMAVLGRTVVTTTIAAGTTTSAAAKQICDAAGVTLNGSTGAVADTVTTTKEVILDKANALDAFQTVSNTELAFVVQQGDELLWRVRGAWTITGSITIFTDDDNYASDYLTIQGLQFSSLADTVADEVLIDVRDGATYTTGTSTGATTFTLQTYNQNGTQAEDLADYVKALFTDDEPQPYSLTYLLNGQNPSEVLYPIEQELRQVQIYFRGVQYDAIVMGFTLSVTPELTRATLNLLSRQQVPFLQLNDTLYGILDQNVLAY